MSALVVCVNGGVSNIASHSPQWDDRYDRTPFMYAAASGSLPIVKAFLARHDLERFLLDKTAAQAVHFAALVSCSSFSSQHASGIATYR